jgi:hypothetical protein
MNIEDDTLAVMDALNAKGVPWMLVGAYSSNYYGIPRSTRDADFVDNGTRICFWLTADS